MYDEQTPTEPGTPRTKLASVRNAWDDLTSNHRIRSDPPFVRRFDRMMGRCFRRVTLSFLRFVRWTIRTAAGTLTAGLMMTALSHLVTWALGWYHR